MRFCLTPLVALSIAACGHVSGSPAQEPSPGNITVTLALASVTLLLGMPQQFQATVSGTTNDAMQWAVNGVTGGNTNVGTITNSGLYTAPADLPLPSSVSITATITGDSRVNGTASVAIRSDINVSLSPASASVLAGEVAAFAASISSAGQPDSQVVWALSSSSLNDPAGTISATGLDSAIYTASFAAVPASILSVTATSVADPSRSASAVVTIACPVTSSVSPLSATIVIGQQQTFTALLCSTSSSHIVWDVDGIVGGNSALGTITSTGGTSALYMAPAAVPNTNPVSVHATFENQSATATVTIVNHLSIAISPAYAFVAPTTSSPSQFQFAATANGLPAANVGWSLSSAVAGQGCVGSACGTVDSNGSYAAPANAPSPNAIAITATSTADPTQSATAIISITSGPVIEQLLPSSVMAGVASSFTLALNGFNFVAGSGVGASTILINGAARSTVCSSSVECTSSLLPQDVSAAGSLSVQIENPGQSVTLSNPVNLVVVPYDVSQQLIALTISSPVSSGNSMIVYEPTTAATGSQINVVAFGLMGGGNCNLQTQPVTITPPSSGSATLSLCVYGNELDPSFSYQFTGPNPNDIAVSASSLSDLLPNLIELTLTIPSTAAPGLRSLFITTPNNDAAAASGILEIE